MKFFKSLKHSAMVAIIGSTLLCGGTASADQAGLDAFKEAMTMSEKHDDRIFREQIIFFLPDLKADVDFQGVAHTDDELRLQGNLNIVATDPKGNTSPLDIPFYLDQSKSDMTLYFKTDKKWKKFKAPIASASAIDVLGTPTEDDLQEWIKLVSNAEILKETNTQRTLLLDLDEAAMTQFMEDIFKEEQEEKMSAEEKVMQEMFQKYLNQGIKNTNVWCTWTIDKQDWQTITFSINLSGIIQETARAALNDPELNLDPMMSNILETLAYYSEFKAYTTYLNPDTKSNIVLPKELKKAKLINDVVPGMS